MESARESALLILFEWDKRGAYLNIAFKNRLDACDAAHEDSAFIKEIVFGTVRHKITLDYIIGQFSKIRLKKISTYILNILRLSIYQILFMDKVPVSAAVNEGVKLAKKFGHSASASFVNALLRAVSKMDTPIYPCPADDAIRYLSVLYSCPETLVIFFMEHFGSTETELILKQSLTEAPLSIRVNSLKTDRENLSAILRGEGIESRNETMCDCALIIGSPGDITKTEAYKSGLFTIQDQSSQLASLALCPKPGDTVLDICAAPGGKTTHLAEIMQNKGRIVATDIYEKRLASVDHAAKRLGINIIETHAHDACLFVPEYKNMFDRILLDVPCSGLGIIRRKPDIKYKEDILIFEQLVTIQKNILNNCAKYLKINGIMVYSTCTINPDENSGVIEDFLKTHENFTKEIISSPHIKPAALDIIKRGSGQIMPSGTSDGFFICSLKRIK